MTTLLAHITVKPGFEAQWETAIAGLVEKTMANETEVIRYEYWKGQAPRTWYALLSFTSKQAFFVHQDADYHRAPAYGEMIENISLEFVDPVSTASPLPRTENPDLPADAPDSIREWEELSPVQVAAWWQDRK
ncbi:MAG: antibiotic biosynthesis monooxygenase [Proteobacteria bacterium]|nr:antibiotic biosynthesis monooxygenase [Pseudomonadota bacterium]